MTNPRWIDDEDGNHILVEGDELLPLPRIILHCKNIESDDQDRIVKALKLLADCEDDEKYMERAFGKPGEFPRKGAF